MNKFPQIKANSKSTTVRIFSYTPCYLREISNMYLQKYLRNFISRSVVTRIPFESHSCCRVAGAIFWYPGNALGSKMADVSSPNPSSEPEKPTIESSDSSAAELQKRISDSFDIFDHESNKTVDVR